MWHFFRHCYRKLRASKPASFQETEAKSSAEFPKAAFQGKTIYCRHTSNIQISFKYKSVRRNLLCDM